MATSVIPKSLAADINDINNTLNGEPWLQPGDNYTTGNDWKLFPAIVMNNGKRLEVTLIANKKISSNRTLTITEFLGAILKPSGEGEHGTNVNYLTKSDCTITPILQNTNYILFRLYFDTAMSMPANTTTYFRGNIKFNVG